MAPNSDHEEVSLEGFGGVLHGPTADYMIHQPTLCNQSLCLASQPVGSMPQNGLDSSAAAGILISGTVGRDGRTNSSNPKANYSKKKNGCHLGPGVKKQRLIWTQELHQYFLEIYNRWPPNEKIVPKKILEKMRERYPYITRENVASHLQKHRLYLKKLKNKELGISAKSSSKSAPVKVTTSESSYSTSANSQLLPQSHSISSSPNARSGTTNFYSNMVNNVSEIQEGYNHAAYCGPIIGQPSNSATRDFSVSINLYPPMNNHIASVLDGSGNGLLDGSGNGSGNNGFNPLMGNSPAEVLQDNNSNDNYFLGTDFPNFGIGDHNDQNMKFVHLDQLDGLNNMCYVGNNSDALEDFADSLSVLFKKEFHSILYPPATHLNNAPTLSQTFAAMNISFPSKVSSEQQLIKRERHGRN